jgi:hypothetical protein
MLNQVMKLSAHPNPMPSQVQVLQHTSAICQVVMNLLDIFANIFELKFAIDDHELSRYISS